MEIKKEDNGRKGAFIAMEGDETIGRMTFKWEGKDRFVIMQTTSSPEHHGKGIGKQLLLDAVDFARQNGKKIRAVCPFVQAQFAKYDDFDDVKA